MRLKDKVAIVTGSGAGIGRAIAVGYARAGAKMVVVDVNATNGEAATAEIPGEQPVRTKEATISLETKDPPYHPYTSVLKERILSHWTYPWSARTNLIQGNLLIVFRLDRGGNLIDCHIARPSGHEILDTFALEAIRSASPFPPFPEIIKVQFLNINASFAYQLRFEQ